MIDRVHQDLLTILSERLFSRGGARLPDDEVCAEAKKQAVYPLIAPKSGAAYIAQNMRVLNAHSELYKLLSEKGIPCVLIKGWASASYYPEPILRQLGDVDFLVPLEVREQTAACLLDSGYTLTEDDNPHHWGYHKDEIEHELHWRLNGAPEGPMGDLVATYIQDIYENACVVETPAGEFKIPSDFHNGLIMLLHMARHMTSSGMGLRHLCDWAVFVNSINDFEGTFKTCFTALGIWRFACNMTAVCVKYLNLSEQTWISECKPSDDLLEATLLDIMGAGNFGKKKATPYTSLLLGDINKDASTNKHGTVRNMIRALNRMSYYYVPVTKKAVILLPIGWFYVILQYICRVIRGKRKLLNPMKTISEANERSRLYASYRLFETE